MPNIAILLQQTVLDGQPPNNYMGTYSAAWLFTSPFCTSDLLIDSMVPLPRLDSTRVTLSVQKSCLTSPA